MKRLLLLVVCCIRAARRHSRVPSPALATEEVESAVIFFSRATPPANSERDQECTEPCEVVSVEESCAAESVHVVRNRMHRRRRARSAPKRAARFASKSAPSLPKPRAPGNLRGDCMADCDARAQTPQNPACCAKACPYTCNKKCKERCSDDDQAVECEPKCVTACDGTCTSEATTEVSGRNARRPSGKAVRPRFANAARRAARTRAAPSSATAQFLNASNLEDCAAELRAELSITRRHRHRHRHPRRYRRRRRQRIGKL